MNEGPEVQTRQSVSTTCPHVVIDFCLRAWEVQGEVCPLSFGKTTLALLLQAELPLGLRAWLFVVVLMRLPLVVLLAIPLWLVLFLCCSSAFIGGCSIPFPSVGGPMNGGVVALLTHDVSSLSVL